MKLRIRCEEANGFATRIENAETGELLDGVVAARWEVLAPDQESFVTLTLKWVDVDLLGYVKEVKQGE